MSDNSNPLALSGHHDIRARLESALAGGPVGQPVYAVYDWFVKNRQIDWPSLFALGLGQINHADLVRREYPNAEIIETTTEADGETRRDVRWVTDLGELHEWYHGEWRREYLIKTPRDYRIMTRALMDTRLTATAEPFRQSERELGDAGITVGQLGRTPMMEVQIDMAGLERFSMDLADELPELMELLELMTELKLREFRQAVKTPAMQIKLWENLSIETMGPTQYKRRLVPLYKQILAILDDAGKKLLVHYDGKLRLIADQIAALPIDGIDSLTPAPEGDMLVAEARSAWPEKFLWLHPSLGWYREDEQALSARIRQMAQDAGPHRFCLMISEDVPPKWQQTVPIVLETLRSLDSS